MPVDNGPIPIDRKQLKGRLAGKVAVITGGAGGMGRAASLQFAAAGARVAILDIDHEQGESAVAAIVAASPCGGFILVLGVPCGGADH